MDHEDIDRAGRTRTIRLSEKAGFLDPEREKREDIPTSLACMLLLPIRAMRSTPAKGRRDVLRKLYEVGHRRREDEEGFEAASRNGRCAALCALDCSVDVPSLELL